MITPIQEYYNNIWRLKSFNLPVIAILLPSDEKIYNIDLNSRTVEAPEFVSVEQDHSAEIIYFKVDRWYDTMDLLNTTCLIQYTNKTTGKSGCYAVPFYDITTISALSNGAEQKILFPWCIDGLAAEKPGDLEYSIKFFSVRPDGIVDYNLNTIPSTTKILKGLNPSDNLSYDPTATVFEQLLAEVQAIKARDDLYWDIIE